MVAACRMPVRKLPRWVIVCPLLLLSRIAFADEEKKSRTEFTPVPIVGGNSNVGFGGGAIISLARVKPGVEPYLWRVELTSTTTFRPPENGGSIEVPYQDHYVLVRLPHIDDGRIELQFRVSYTRESTLKYYGIGNQSSLPPGRDLTDSFFEYDWTHPTLWISSKYDILSPFSVDLGIRYTHNWLDVPAGTKLAEDASDNSAVSDFIGPLREHGVATFSYGLAADTRDHSVSPTKGMHHQVRLDWSPGGTHALPYNFWRADASLCFYLPIGHDGSALAFRGVGDLLFGDPPIYELARFDQTGAFGGPNGVRGVPGQRYHGKVKIFGNAELRKNLFRFRFLSKENRFGVAAFADAGRLFADYHARPDLDGKSVGLKLGLGGGLRVTGGESFVLRGDVAWSPDARPIGVYLASGQLF